MYFTLLCIKTHIFFILIPSILVLPVIFVTGGEKGIRCESRTDPLLYAFQKSSDNTHTTVYTRTGRTSGDEASQKTCQGQKFGDLWDQSVGCTNLQKGRKKVTVK